jgi:hypothetical protein
MSDKEMYKALDNELFRTIEGFKTPDEHETTASLETWISHIPPILMFQIKRVEYDNEAGCAKKNHGEFRFTQVFYADRMLESKRELSL